MAAPAESFEDGVSHLFIMMEELRRSLPASFASNQQHDDDDDDIDSELQQLDGIVGRLDFLARKAADDPHDDVKRDLYKHASQKVADIARLVFDAITKPAADKSVFDGNDNDSQGQVARMTELCLMVYQDMLKKVDDDDNLKEASVQEIVNLYAQYQRQVLRQRSKPAIAHLASWRASSPQHSGGVIEDDDDDEDVISQPHSHAITTILGQAAALIHPLSMWNVPPESPITGLCQESIQVLDEQAQALTKTICDWFLVDKKVDEYWMKQSAEASASKVDLSALDGLVDEMAYCSQVMARYQALVEGGASAATTTTTIRAELLPELTWKYASLERFLAVQQLSSALLLATPVNIVLGLPIKVPSVVEDAQYLSTRALDRAVSTMNSQAMGTVAHSLSHDIWSTSDSGGGVYTALLEQKGCWGGDTDTNATAKPSTGGKMGAPPPKSDDFASALLDALDQDLVKTPPPTSAPASGGFLGSLMVGGDEFQQLRLDTQLCALNGILSASTACRSLVMSLDAWLEEHAESNMISLAREELDTYSHAYGDLMQSQATGLIVEWCGAVNDGQASLKGKCLHSLRDFFGRESYQLDNTSFSKAEADDRLESVLLGPLKESRLISQLDKCESEVGLAILEDLSTLLADLIIESLWQHEKRFTDWGSLLISKQVRLLQTHVTGLLTAASEEHAAHQAPPPSFLTKWERLSQVVTVLQLERPSDWNIYQATSVLTADELRRTLSLRVDFSRDAITSICQAQGN